MMAPDLGARDDSVQLERRMLLSTGYLAHAERIEPGKVVRSWEEKSRYKFHFESQNGDSNAVLR